MPSLPSPLWKIQPTPQDEAWGLYVTALGSGAELPPLPGTGWRLHFLVRGTASLMPAGRRRLRLEAGDVVLLEGSGEASLAPDLQTTCRIHFVDFAGSWMTHWLAQGFFSPAPPGSSARASTSICWGSSCGWWNWRRIRPRMWDG